MIAIITARGGSKGLPRKNVLTFCGKPLIAHTINAAKNSQAIDRIIVSTDDEEIAVISREFGAEVPFMRPPELATDEASSREVLLHALDFMEKQGVLIDSFCLLQPTSPLRTAADIEGAFKIFIEKSADSVLSITPYEHPVQWAVEMKDNGILQPREKGKAGRRQELVEYYRPNGAVYMFRTDFFKASTGYFGPSSYGYIMPPERSIDIDTQLDFVAAETIAHYLQGNPHD
jgi:N-acylneuraminate cytidylyltransferase/CMP-N,N'-diacetyllegionaminic acid synthase